MGPLVAAFIVVPFGQTSVVWFSALALIGIVILTRVSRWYAPIAPRQDGERYAPHGLPRKLVGRSIAILVVLVSWRISTLEPVELLHLLSH